MFAENLVTDRRSEVEANDNHTFINFSVTLATRNDHTTVTAPLPVGSAKLSTVGPG